MNHFAGMKARIFQGSPSGKGKTPEIPGGRDPKEAVLEAVLFLADEPVPAKKIASVCGFATAAETRKVLRGLQKKIHSGTIRLQGRGSRWWHTAF